MTSEERAAFMNSPPITLNCGEESITLRAKQFATGSVGYYANGKWMVHGYRVQVNCIFTVVGSKPEIAGEQASRWSANDTEAFEDAPGPKKAPEPAKRRPKRS